MGLELEGPYRSWVSLISPLFFSAKAKRQEEREQEEEEVSL